MCGRFKASFEFREIKIRWNLQDDLPVFTPHYNIAPSQDHLIVVGNGRKNSLRLMRWGLVPSWAKDESVGNRMINARAETLVEKPSFKDLLSSRRCLIPADGFYEWRKEGRQKVPMCFKLKSGEPFAFAGLWDSWRKRDGTLLNTFTIITTQPNDLLRPIHDRMPVVLSDEDAFKWINDNGRELLSLLKPYPAGEMDGYEVSTLVNSPDNDGPECIQPDRCDEPTLF